MFERLRLFKCFIYTDIVMFIENKVICMWEKFTLGKKSVKKLD